MTEIFILGVKLFLSLFLSLIALSLLSGQVASAGTKNLLKSTNYFVFLLTSLGTVIHELSHLIVAILFGFKITQVKLLRPIGGYKDGVMGLVNYSYNPKSIKDRIGCFFVSFAPVLGGLFALILSLKFLLPKAYTNLISSFNLSSSLTLKDFFEHQSLVTLNLFNDIFNINNFTSIKFFIFIFVALSICAHITLSPADLKGSWIGIVTLILVFIFLSFAGTIFNFNFLTVVPYVYTINYAIISLLSISLFFSIIYFLISLIVFFLKSKLFKKF